MLEILIHVLVIGGHPVAYTLDESACLSMRAEGSECHAAYVDERDLDDGAVDHMLARYDIVCDEPA